METILTCPLGHKCEDARDGKIYQCGWFVKLKGTNPNTGEEIDQKGCGISWMPILQIENAKETKGIGAAIENARNTIYGILDK